MSLSDTLKITRQKAFLTQEAFAEELNVSTATINRWENDKSRPNLTALKNIKEFCSNHELSYAEIGKEWFQHSSEVIL